MSHADCGAVMQVCSLVDTAAVGQVSSVQLAALSPCTAIFNLVFLVRFFLSPQFAWISCCRHCTFRRWSAMTNRIRHTICFRKPP